MIKKLPMLIIAGALLLGSVGGVSMASAQLPKAVASPSPVVQSIQKHVKADQNAIAKEADKNLPGGGHNDTDGINVDHNFNGEE